MTVIDRNRNRSFSQYQQLAAHTVAMNRKVSTLVENIAESGSACLITMVQGNVLAIGIGHWVVASQTGLVAGATSVAALAVANTDNRWAIAGILGAVTAIVDYFIHPSMIGDNLTEALITGTGAAALSLIVHELVVRYRRWKASAREAAG